MPDYYCFGQATMVKRIAAASPAEAAEFWRRWLRQHGATAAVRGSATVMISSQPPKILDGNHKQVFPLERPATIAGPPAAARGAAESRSAASPL